MRMRDQDPGGWLHAKLQTAVTAFIVLAMAPMIAVLVAPYLPMIALVAVLVVGGRLLIRYLIHRSGRW